jgi:ubiquinone/menaquinone biosynthesis C-methylase UbiE
MSAEQRSRVIPLASGLVLEIGIGTGNTLPVYDPHKVEHITGLDPSGELWARRKTELADLDFEVDFIRGSAEWLPFEDASFDTVVSTFTLCSVRMVEPCAQTRR